MVSLSGISTLTSQTELAKEGIRHLGYPVYFGNALVVFKVLGVLALVIPQIPKRVKEWAYAGFAFDFIFATISHGAVDGINGQTFFPLVVFGILSASYIYYHKLNSDENCKEWWTLHGCKRACNPGLGSQLNKMTRNNISDNLFQTGIVKCQAKNQA